MFESDSDWQSGASRTGVVPASNTHSWAALYGVSTAMPMIPAKDFNNGWDYKLSSERACTATPALAQRGAAQESRRGSVVAGAK